ncbi:MAG: tetratricopeptide repeat protein [Muribaculaceae bacterium]|nr:tetratricopeptide repeat protein [Muribaculaceae bacterium]
MRKGFFNNLKYLFLYSIFLLSCLLPIGMKAQINAEQVLTIGRNVLSMDDYMLAIQYFNQAIKAKPYLADPYFFRALAKLNLDDYAGAEADCDMAILNNKFKTEAYKLRGFARQVQGKDSLAVEDYNIGLSYNPLDKNFLFYKALALTELKKYDEADSTFNILLRQYPRFDSGFTARARLELERNDTTAALDDIERALSISKAEINPYLMKAEIFWKRQDWPNAASAIDAAIRLRPELPDLYVNRAFVRYNSDDFFGAMSDYNYAIEIDPDNSAAYFNRGLLRYEVKDLEKAEQDMSQVVRLNPENVHAYFNRGLIELEEEKYKEALADFRIIEKRYPRFYPIYYAMAEAERNLGNNRQAAFLIHKGEELVEGYVHDPEKNPLDRPAIAASQTHSVNRNGEDEDESETEVMERFNHLVTISQATDQNLSYNEKIKGRVQDRNVNVEMEPSYALTLAVPEESLKSLSNYFRELDDLNQMRILNHTIYLSPGLESTNYGDMMTELFDISSQLRAGKGVNMRPADYLLLGITETMLRNYPSALENLDAAIASNPQFTVAFMARGYARYANAISDLKIANENKNEEEAFLDRNIYTALLQEALADYDKVLSLNPRVVYAWFNKGNIYYEAQDYTSAMQAYSEAIKIDPEFGEAYFNRGLAYLNSGNKAQAFADLSKAGELGVIPSYNILKRMK